MPATDTIKLVYDRECPVCRFYAERVHLADGELECVNAREQSELQDEISAAGIDIDSGMVVKVGDELHFGGDAVHELALRSSGAGFFNKLIARLFRSPHVTKILYPPLVRCRNGLLRILGRTRINNLGKADKRRF